MSNYDLNIFRDPRESWFPPYKRLIQRWHERGKLVFWAVHRFEACVALHLFWAHRWGEHVGTAHSSLLPILAQQLRYSQILFSWNPLYMVGNLNMRSMGRLGKIKNVNTKNENQNFMHFFDWIFNEVWIMVGMIWSEEVVAIRSWMPLHPTKGLSFSEVEGCEVILPYVLASSPDHVHEDESIMRLLLEELVECKGFLLPFLTPTNPCFLFIIINFDD